MEDKLLKILKIKIDAINRNIDNLNYLNGELERNNKDLDYIKEKLELFSDGNVLNFDNINKDDFEKILLMVNSNVSDIFKDKTCNYDGIIYIIEGIRKSISLELTNEQTNAIMAFIEGIKEKQDNLLETINNLLESKNRLPETDLNVLTNNLDGYNNIVSKFENNLYLTEIDEISNALNFADVEDTEKSDIYEYILKYNADIYSLKENDDFSNTENVVNNENYDLDLPDFNYDTVKVTNDLLDEKEKNDVEEVTTEESDNSLDDIKFNLDALQDNEISIQTDSSIQDSNPIDIDANLNNENDLAKFDDNLNLNIENEVKNEEDNHELNTIELEDIIKKIDDKLKEMEDEKTKEFETEEPSNEVTNTFGTNSLAQNVSSELNTNDQITTNEEFSDYQNNTSNLNLSSDNNEPQVTLNDLYNKYSINELNITNNNLNNVDKMLQILVDNNLLNIFKDNKDVFEIMLSNFNNSDLEELITLIKDNLIVKSDEFDSTFNILVETIPVLFTNINVFESFKENLKFYSEKNINIINILDNYRELLIINHEELINNYNKVVSYGLEINSDNVKYLLYNKNILDNLDYYIEAIGYEKGFLGKEDRFDGVEYIKKNPYKLNNASRDMLLKLRYTSENNGKIYGNKPGVLAGEIANPKVDIIKLTSDYLNTYFNGQYNEINKNELKLELSNLNNFDMTLDGNLNLLDKNYKKDELRYQFDNVIISRIKTIRIYNYLKNKLAMKDALIIALTYNSVIKNDEYEKIVNIVNNIVGGM